MDLQLLNDLMKNKKIAFGPKENKKKALGEYLGLQYIQVNTEKKQISFTTDTLDYSMSHKLEEALEMLYNEFGIVNYIIDIHIHKGKWHDKDIIIQMKDIDNVQNIEEMPEVIKFIQDHFYNVSEWDYT